MKRISIIISIVLLMLAFSSLTLANEPKSDEWRQAMFLAEDSRDMMRLTNYEIKHWPNYIYPDIMGFITKLDAQIDMSKIYIEIYPDIEMLIEDYEITGEINLDHYEKTVEGIPIGYAARFIMVPVYSKGKIAGIIKVMDWVPHEERPVDTTDNQSGGEFMSVEDESFLYEVDEEPKVWTYAQDGYALLRAMDVEPCNVVVQGEGKNNKVCIFVTKTKDFYVYPVAIKGEESKGNQVITLENYIKALASNIVVSPIIEATPTVSRTPFQPMTTTPTATPRPSGTGIAPRPTASAGSGTGTAAVSPTASPTVPGPKKAELTWLIPVVVLCCAAAGGIAWAAIAAGKKKKDK